MPFLLLLSLILIFLIVRRFVKRNDLSFCMAVTGFLFIVWFLTEALSFKRLITPTVVVGAWIAISVILLVLCVFLFSRRKTPADDSDLIDLSSFSIYEKILMVVIAAVVIMVGIESFLVVPNNWDSMTYHLPRIMHWVQNRSVSYYFTSEYRQNCSPAFAEYILMHVYLLSFSKDTYFNLLQFFSYIFTLTGIYFACERIIKRRIFRLFAVLLFACAPIAMAEATTTQVDLVSAAIFIVFLNLILYLYQAEKLNISRMNISVIICISLCIGFEFLTKNSVCIAMACVLAALLIRCIRRRDRVLHLICYVAMAMILVLAVCCLNFYRNLTWYGDILAGSYFTGISTGTFDPRYVSLNLYKNFALLLSNKVLKGFLATVGYGLAKLFGADLDADSISFSKGTMFSKTLPAGYHHDTANVTVIAVLAVVAFILWIVRLSGRRSKTLENGGKSKRRFRENDGIVISMMIGSILMMMITRYQTWGVRLFMVPIVMTVIFIAYEADQFIMADHKGCPKAALTAGFIILLIAVLYPAVKTLSAQDYSSPATLSDSKERYYKYFTNRMDVADDYFGACTFINDNHYDSVGLMMGGDCYEYPIWAGINRKAIIDCIDESGDHAYRPDCILSSYLIAGSEEYDLMGEKYVLKWSAEDQNMFVYQKESYVLDFQ